VKDIRLRSVFDEVADLYARHRPDYPDELFHELIATTGIDQNSKLLEIAPGTGQATLNLAKRGFDILAVELGERMAELARRRLRDYPAVRVSTAAFEDVDLSTESFDLVYIATALHWIKPESQFSRPHQALKPHGYLAIITSTHISDGDDRFFEATQPLYNKYMPPSPDDLPFRLKELDEISPNPLDDQLFELFRFRCFPRTMTYSAEEYCGLLNTESDKLALPRDVRADFLREMAELVRTDFAGVATRRYANALTIGKKRD
jgi:ubiquinone/menaquinone biosynthesis C-methylase UbiE